MHNSSHPPHRHNTRHCLSRHQAYHLRNCPREHLRRHSRPIESPAVNTPSPSTSVNVSPESYILSLSASVKGSLSVPIISAADGLPDASMPSASARLLCCRLHLNLSSQIGQDHSHDRGQLPCTALHRGCPRRDHEDLFRPLHSIQRPL